METTWKPVKVYNNNLSKLYDYTGIYIVSNTGKIKNIKRKSLLTDYKHESGYHTVSLSKDGFAKSFFLHRVVACSFYQNTSKKYFVNHIDRYKSNNNAVNIEWSTIHENNKHARETGLNSYKRPVIQYDINNNYIQTYPSIKDAAISINCSPPDIINYIKHNNLYGGFILKYKNTSEDCSKNNITYYNPSNIVFISDVVTNSNYEIYNNGQIYSKLFKRFLNPSITNGYLSVILHPEKKIIYYIN